MLVRVYIALRGSHSHEASNRLQFFLGVYLFFYCIIFQPYQNDAYQLNHRQFLYFIV